jgi:hypothetical protein
LIYISSWKSKPCCVNEYSEQHEEYCLIDFEQKIIVMGTPNEYPPITYYWTVPRILDHSYLVKKLTSSKTADTKVSDFRGSKAFVSAIFEIFKFPTRYELSNIRGTVQ